jgi:hypothetical protein
MNAWSLRPQGGGLHERDDLIDNTGSSAWNERERSIDNTGGTAWNERETSSFLQKGPNRASAQEGTRARG